MSFEIFARNRRLSWVLISSKCQLSGPSERRHGWTVLVFYLDFRWLCFHCLIPGWDGVNVSGLRDWFWISVGFQKLIGFRAPTSGGQYHWVSEFAPPRYQKCLSYLTGKCIAQRYIEDGWQNLTLEQTLGWISIMSWQSGVAGGVFLTGTITQKLIVLNCPSYDAPRWQGTLCVIVVIFIVLSINIFGAKRLPFLQNVFLVLHVLSFVAIMIVLWVVARIQPTKAVFTHFENNGGWNSMGLSLMVGQVTSVYMVICKFTSHVCFWPREGGSGGADENSFDSLTIFVVFELIKTPSVSDAAAHMSEEVQDAGLVIPRAMTMSYVMGGVTGLISLTTFLFCISNVSDALNDSTGFPFLYVLRSSMSDGAATAITVIMLFLGFMGLIDGSASASRQIWAFARDRGVPFFRWISHVSQQSIAQQNSAASRISMQVALQDLSRFISSQNNGYLWLTWDILGSSNTSHPWPRPRPHRGNSHFTFLNQHRIHNRLQRNRLPPAFLSHDRLRRLNRLRAIPTPISPRTTSPSALEPRTIWSSNKRGRADICHLCLFLVLLANPGKGWCLDVQLGHGHVRDACGC